MDGRYYNVTVTGDVQDIGFCKFIESAANSYHDAVMYSMILMVA